MEVIIKLSAQAHSEDLVRDHKTRPGDAGKAIEQEGSLPLVVDAVTDIFPFIEEIAQILRKGRVVIDLSHQGTHQTAVFCDDLCGGFVDSGSGPGFCEAFEPAGHHFGVQDLTDAGHQIGIAVGPLHDGIRDFFDIHPDPVVFLIFLQHLLHAFCGQLHGDRDIGGDVPGASPAPGLVIRSDPALEMFDIGDACQDDGLEGDVHVLRIPFNKGAAEFSQKITEHVASFRCVNFINKQNDRFKRIPAPFSNQGKQLLKVCRGLSPCNGGYAVCDSIRKEQVTFPTLQDMIHNLKAKSF